MSHHTSFNVRYAELSRFSREPIAESIPPLAHCHTFLDLFEKRPASLEYQTFPQEYYLKVVQGAIDSKNTDTRNKVSAVLQTLAERGDLKFPQGIYLSKMALAPHLGGKGRIDDLFKEIKALFSQFAPRSIAVPAPVSMDMDTFVVQMGRILLSLDHEVSLLSLMHKLDEEDRKKFEDIEMFAYDQFVLYKVMRLFKNTFKKEGLSPEINRVREIFPMTPPCSPRADRTPDSPTTHHPLQNRWKRNSLYNGTHG